MIFLNLLSSQRGTNSWQFIVMKRHRTHSNYTRSLLRLSSAWTESFLKQCLLQSAACRWEFSLLIMKESAGEIHETQRYEILHLGASQLLPNNKRHLNKSKIYAHFLTNFACLNIKQTKPNQTKLTRGQCDLITNLFYKHVFVFLYFF